MRGKYRPHHILQVVLLFIALAGLSASNSKANENSKYLNAVREFADNVLKYGRDTYGPKQTPLFVDGLNIHTHEPVKWISPKGDVFSATETEEWILSNFASQQTLLRTLDGLSKVTGDPKYRDAAVQAIKYAFENLMAPNGLFYWGHSAAYDAQADRIRTPGRHVLKVHYPYYELLWQVNPDATKKFIEAFWSAHVLDWSNLDFNRISWPYSDSLETPWNHEFKGGPTFFESSRLGANGFFHTGTSLTYAGAMLYRFSDQKQSLVWSKRLMQRFIDTRNPKTGITAHLYNKPQRMFPNENMKENFSDPYTTVFPFHPFEEKRKGQLMYFGENWQPLPWISLLLTGHMLGEDGREFTRWALEELTAWSKASYRKRDNVFVPILTDGTNIEGVVLEDECALGFKGDIAKSLFAGPEYFWAYATAYRVTSDAFMWQMARDVGIGNGFGDIGEGPTENPKLRSETDCSDVYGLLGFLDLYARTNEPELLTIAQRIADNIIENKFHKGFFVLSNQHIYSRFDCFEPLALLCVAEAIDSGKSSIPQVWPECPIFVPPYRYKQMGSDRWHIYRLTDSPEVPWSLQEASHIGNINQVKALLEGGTNIDSTDDSFRMTALQRAAMRGHKEIVELLLAKGASLNLHEGWPGGTALDYAAENGHKEIVELLIANGANINTRRAYPVDDTPLHTAVRNGHKDIVGLLIEKGADVNAKNDQGETPLDVVGSRNRRQITELLLAKGAKATSIHKAASMGMMVDTKDFLEKGVDVNAKDQDGRTPIHLAVQEGHKEVVEVLVSKKADVNAKDGKGRTPLHVAVERRNKDVVDLLIKKGADVNAKNGSGETPLDIDGYNTEIASLLMSAGAKTSSIHRAALWGLQSEVKRFLEEGVDVNAKNENGWAPLHLAAQARRIDVMELLISKGADVNACNPKGQTSLHLVLWPREQKTVKEAMDLLLSKGTGLNAKDNSGSTVLDDVAFGGSELAIYFEFFLSKNRKLDNIHFAAYQGDIDRIKSFLKEGVDINEKRTTKQRTPLDYAVRGGKVEVVKLLISEGADIDAGAKDTPAFIHAVRSGDTEIAEFLLDNGADVNVVTGQLRMTALHVAVVRRNKEMVQLLIQNGADVNAKIIGRMAMTPLDIAKMVKNNEMIDLLKKHGAKGTATSSSDTDANQPTRLLSTAVQAGDIEQVKKHLKDGANVNAKDVQGRTVLDLARQRGQTEIVKLIVKHDLQSTDPPEPRHDVSVTNITAPSACAQGDTIAITVNVANQGTFRESFAVTLSNPADSEKMATKTVTLGKKWNGRADDTPDLIFNPENTKKNLMGNRVCIGGDVNRDGFKDILLGVLAWQDWRGRANVYFGGPSMDTQADVVFKGENKKDRLSDQSGAFGDVNHDGYDDIIIGAPFYPSFKGDGRVYVFHGGPSMDSTPDMILEGPADERSLFGLMITTSDINQDGMVDILVGAQNYDHGGESNPFYDNGRGRVYLYWGGDPMDTTPDVIFEGEKRGDWFGRRISANGDVNGDGYNDILIGARHAGGEINNGAVYLFLGSSKEGMDSVCDWTFRGEGKDHQMGYVDIFDIDADGYNDVIVGARGAAGYHGRVYIYWGARDFDGSRPGLILEGPTQSAMCVNIACGYFNNDQYGDILAGAYAYPGTGYMYGRAYLFYGNTKSAMDTDHDYIFAGESGKNDFFGCQLSAGDLNSDGYTDALIGAEGAHNDMGRAYLYYGPFHDTTDITFKWNTSNTSPGKHILKASIAPVAGEKDIENNTVTVTIEVKEK